MIGTSPLEYAWVVTWVVILHSIGPLCVSYCVVARFLPDHLRLWRYLEYWAYIETTFYFATYAYRKYHLEYPATHPPPLIKEERGRLFRRCFDTSHDLTTSLSRWFLEAPIVAVKRENIKEWLRWAFLNTAMEDPTHEDELDSYVKVLETKLGVTFEPGRADVKSIRLTLDKVDALHRSLTWYLCIFVVDILTHTYMCIHGFHFYRGSMANSFGMIPPRPQALLTTHRSPSQAMSYWYRRHTSATELPIVFLHGIGVGLWPYMQLLKELNQGRRKEDGQIGILAIEILSISSRITTPVPQKDELCQRLRSILQYHGFDRFVLVSHSYGSVISTHLLKTPDLARRITSVILVDPVSILLHRPDVVYNFTVRAPKYANEWLLWYFGSKDMGVAHTLSRTFFWSQNILWKDDLLAHRSTVFLSGKDSIINAREVRQYLEDQEEQDIAKDELRQWQGQGNQASIACRPGSVVEDQEEQDTAKDKLIQGQGQGQEQRQRQRQGTQASTTYKPGTVDVIWCADLDHGQVFDLAVWRERLKREILHKARIE